MDLGIKGKVALVAAPARASGARVAEELATEGASLVICRAGPGALRRGV
jgi:3-oxoacyl-[acyl-carrier protein] reductase